MNPAQEAAFRSANFGGSSFASADALLLFAAVASVLVLFWFVWVSYSAYQAWSANSLNGNEAGSQVLRALFVTVVTLAIVGL